MAGSSQAALPAGAPGPYVRGMTLTPAPPRPPVATESTPAPVACYAAALLSPVGGALLAWAVGRFVGRVDLVVGRGADAHTVGPGSVLAVSLVAALAALGLAAVLARTARRPRRTWVAVATIVFLVSLLGPLAGATATAQWQLAALHTVVALALLGSVPRLLPAARLR